MGLMGPMDGSFWEDWEDWEKWVSNISQNSQISKTVVFNDTPKCRSEEARECGSVPRLRVPRMRERKARKVVNAGNAERGARMSGMFVKLKNVMFNDTPMSRNADGCPSVYAGRMGRNRCPE